MNELSTMTTAQTNLAAPSSLFDSMDAFRDAYKIAEILCQTQLIPSNFQRKPADVLVALDYSRRLGVPPTAILPHLYVINGRPAMSAQMLIGLVNRSGVFSRIQWEEKVDGVVEWTRDGVKQSRPNVAARAYFTELSTGEKFYSPWIDLKLALSSGWLTKTGSKWLEMPTIMARYRSASVLIKSVCPELALGMDFADELSDEAPQTQARAIEVNAAQEENDETRIDDESSNAAKMIVEIGQCKTIDELQAIGERIAGESFSTRELDHIRAAYLERKKSLTDSTQEKPAPKKRGRKPAQPEEPEPVKTSEESSGKGGEEPESDERRDRSIEILQEGMQQIAECERVELLKNHTAKSIQAAVDDGTLLDEHAAILRARIQERIQELENEARA